MWCCGLHRSSGVWVCVSRIGYDEHSDLVDADIRVGVEQGVIARLFARGSLRQSSRAYPPACARGEHEAARRRQADLMGGSRDGVEHADTLSVLDDARVSLG